MGGGEEESLGGVTRGGRWGRGRKGVSEGIFIPFFFLFFPIAYGV